MRILRGLTDFTAEIPRPILTIGNFDGVHLGHRAIFQQIIQRAQAIGGTSVMLTFDPHPLKVLRPAQAPLLITTFEEKMRLLDELGLQMAISLPFTAELSTLSPQQFVEEILLKKIGIRELYVGHDFAFGRGRKGTIACLREMGVQRGFAVRTVEPVFLEDQVVSSSLIRRLIRQGEVQQAAHLLGRPYSLEGIPERLERPYIHTLLRSLCGQPFAPHPSSGGLTECDEPFPMANGRQPLDLKRDMGSVSASRLLPQKELIPPPGFYEVQILQRAGVPAIQANQTHLCQIPSPQDHCPPRLYLWEVPGEVEGERWEIAFLRHLSHFPKAYGMKR